MASVDLTISYHYGITPIVGVVSDHASRPIPYGRVFWYPKIGPAIKIESDANGVWEFLIKEGEIGTLVIPSMYYDKKITVPPLESGQLSVHYLDAEEYTRFVWPTVKFYV